MYTPIQETTRSGTPVAAVQPSRSGWERCYTPLRQVAPFRGPAPYYYIRSIGSKQVDIKPHMHFASMPCTCMCIQKNTVSSLFMGLLYHFALYIPMWIAVFCIVYIYSMYIACKFLLSPCICKHVQQWNISGDLLLYIHVYTSASKSCAYSH